MDNYDIIKNMYKMMGLQAGYKLDDKKEFEIVRKTLILNGLPCENFDRNLERLVIEKSNIFDYVPSLCKIHVVPGYDNLVHELFHMASDRDNSGNLGSMYHRGIGCSLNEGITDYMSNKALADYNMFYIFEAFYYKMLAKMYGGEKILVSHFNGNVDGVYDTFGDEKRLILDTTSELDKYTRSAVNSSDAFDRQEYNNMQISYDSLVNAFSELFNIYSYNKDKSYGYMLLIFRTLLEDTFNDEDENRESIYGKFERKLLKRD